MPEAQAVRASKPRQSRLWLFVNMSIAYYRSHLISLFMSLVLPLIFLSMYAFAYFVNAAPTPVVVALAPKAQAALAQRMESFPPGSLKVIPSEANASEILRRGIAQIAVDEDDSTHRIVFYANPGSVGIAKMLAMSTASISTTAPQPAGPYEVRPYTDPKSPLSFLPGILLMSILNLSLFTTGVKLLQDRSQGTLRLFRMLPAPLWHFFGAEVLSKLLLGLVQSVAFIGLAILMTGVGVPLVSALATLFICGAATVCLLSLGIALGSALKSFSSGMHVFTIVNLAIMFLGDVFFPSSQYEATRPFALAIPTTYLADFLRHSLFGVALRFPLWLSMGYIIAFTMVCFSVAMTQFRFTARA